MNLPTPLLADGDMPTFLIICAVAGIIVFLVLFAIMAQFVGLYIRARVSGAARGMVRTPRHAPPESQRPGHRQQPHPGQPRRT